MSRETELKLVFPAVTYYDGQGFMIRRSRPATSALELDNTKVCVAERHHDGAQSRRFLRMPTT